MNYVMSDIHGHLKAYLLLLEQAHFHDTDNLYVLGDIVGKGPEPVALLRDMMYRVNVFPLLGQNDYLAMRMLQCLQDRTAMQKLPKEELSILTEWVKGDGRETVRQLQELSGEERDELLEYMGEFMLYAQVRAGGREFVLVHAGLDHFTPDRDMEDYHYKDLLYHAPNYDRVYFPNRYLVTGHTPTVQIDPEKSGQVIEKNGHIAIDCGAALGLRLGMYCLETGESFYVDIGEER